METSQKEILNLETKNSKLREELGNDRMKYIELNHDFEKTKEELNLLRIQEKDLSGLIDILRKSYENEKSKTNELKFKIIELENKISANLKEKILDNYQEKNIALQKSYDELKSSFEEYKKNTQIELKKLIEKTERIPLDIDEENVQDKDEVGKAEQNTPKKESTLLSPRTPKTPKVKAPIPPPMPDAKRVENCK